MHTVDLVNLSISKLARFEVDLRFIHGDGLSSGLCRVGQRRILFMNDAASVTEQMEVIADTFRQLGVDLSGLPTPLKTAIQSQWEKHESMASSNPESLTAS